MKNLLFLIFFVAFTVSGQTYVDNSQVIDNTNLQTTNSQLNVATDQNQINTATQFVNQNSVFIEQVGSGNNALINVASDNSQVNLIQRGTNNTTTLQHTADYIRQNVVQIGVSNRVFDSSRIGATSHTLDVTQRGDYNTTISTGSNSLSQNMKVNQTGNGSSVYILNF